MNLSDRIHQSHFASAAQEALLNVLVTESWVRGELTSTLAPQEITPAQYNVLRILRGSHPKPLNCSDIAERLLDRTPDVTRLLVRLQRGDLIARQRAEHDRRVVEVSITDKGLNLLDRLDDPVDNTIARLTQHLTNDELETLSGLLDRLRTDQDD